MKGNGFIFITSLVLTIVTAKAKRFQAGKQKLEERQIDEKFRNEILYWHNYYRGQRLTAPLQYHQNLEAWAELWAQRLAYYDRIEHRPPRPNPVDRMGENIYWMTNTRHDFKPSAKDVADLWYKEIYQYNYHSPGYSPSTSHFTQMVWKGTQYVGCAWARSQRTRITYVVCNYWPQGNIIGHFAENVR